MDKVPAIQVGGLEGGGAQHQPLASFTVVCVRERETFPLTMCCGSDLPTAGGNKMTFRCFLLKNSYRTC